MVRFSLAFVIIVFCFAANSAAQETEYEPLKPAEFKKQVLTKDRFVNVLPRVRGFHAVGTIMAFISIDADGELERLFVGGFGPASFMQEYVKAEVTTWKFKPLRRKGKPVAYRGVLLIPFCYGTFPKKRWC